MVVMIISPPVMDFLLRWSQLLAQLRDSEEEVAYHSTPSAFLNRKGWGMEKVFGRTPIWRSLPFSRAG